MKFTAFMVFSFIIFLRVLLVLFLYNCVYGFMFFILLFNSAHYLFLLLCMLCSVYSVFIMPTGILWLP